MLQKEI